MTRPRAPALLVTLLLLVWVGLGAFIVGSRKGYSDGRTEALSDHCHQQVEAVLDTLCWVCCQDGGCR